MSAETESGLTFNGGYGMITTSMAMKGSFPSDLFRERSVGVRTQVKSGLSPWSSLPEQIVGKCGSARYSCLSARKGIQVVPRKS